MPSSAASRSCWRARAVPATSSTSRIRGSPARSCSSPSWPPPLRSVILPLPALALRLVILLHPQFYYPDVRVHALFAWQLGRRGLVGFLRHFTEDQVRFRLGLASENGH